MPRPCPPLPRARRARTIGVASLLAVAAVLGACSSSGGSSAADAPAAASVVSETFRLPDDAQACIEEQLTSDSTARDALMTTDELSTGQRDALAGVLETCVTVQHWAEAIAGRITAAVPPTDASQTATQAACLTDGVLALDDEQRHALLVGLVVIGTAPSTGNLAAQRGDALNGLYARCSVVVGGSGTSSSSAPSPSGG